MHDDSNDTGVLATLRNQSGVIFGLVGLIAWCAMLWYMFGDVL